MGKNYGKNNKIDEKKEREGKETVAEDEGGKDEGRISLSCFLRLMERGKRENHERIDKTGKQEQEVQTKVEESEDTRSNCFLQLLGTKFREEPEKTNRKKTRREM